MPRLQALGKLIRVQALLFLRDPLSVFFTLLFAPAFLVMLEVAAPVSGAADLGIHVPGYAAIVIGTKGVSRHKQCCQRHHPYATLPINHPSSHRGLLFVYPGLLRNVFRASRFQCSVFG
ncbi:MAG: hypothetical protein R6U70_06270, partial [Bacillota bacterium]